MKGKIFVSLLNFARFEVVSLAPSSSIEKAAKVMDEKNVGCVVVVEEEKPIGILTDRDIVVRAISKSLDVKTTQIDKAMTPDPVTLDEGLGLFEALETMKQYAVRRFPIVDSYGKLSGFFSLDDVMYLLGIEMSAVARIIEQEGP